MMNRKCLMALFAVASTISVCLVLQYWEALSHSYKKITDWTYSSANSTDQKGNSVAPKTNQTTALQGNSKSIEETKDNTASSDNSTNFIYLTQTESCIPPYLLHPDIFGYPRKNDVVVLSWQRPCAEENSTHFKHIKYIYKAKSSWSEGRNILYRYAKEMPKNYLYYIFMDDDVIF